MVGITKLLTAAPYLVISTSLSKAFAIALTGRYVVPSIINGFVMPKPLIEINDKPFFYWATKSISSFVDVEDITFVVLEQHINEFSIDSKIMEFFPESKIVIIPEILNGAVLTCMNGIKKIN